MILELRNYLFRPRMMEHFIDYFEEHFIFSQESVGIQVLGQFRPIGEPNRFVWIRGFSDMQTRLESLQTFYNGPVWEKYKTRANEMMIEWHNVRLLRPISDIAYLTRGVDANSIAIELAAGTISPETGMIAVDFYRAVAGKRDALLELIMPVYQDVKVRGLFVAEMGENQFTRQPAIQNENELVVITAYESEEMYREQHDKLINTINETTGAFLSTPPESLLLTPTLRSPLRYS